MARTSKRPLWDRILRSKSARKGARGPVAPPLRCERLEERMLLTADLMTSPGVVLHTNQGDIGIDLFAAETPITVDNFLNYVNDGDYDNVFFHRSVPGFIIQTGGFSTTQALFEGSVPSSIATDPPILNEPGISNIRATVAMAKLAEDPNSATSQFFVNLADNSSNLDNQNGGFTVFGNVADMTVPDAIASLPTFAFASPYTNLPLAGSAPNQTLVVIESVSGDGEIRGTLFEDTDRDGQQGVGESVISGGSLFVDANDDGILDPGELTTVTDVDGSYSFNVVGGQTHVVRQVLPIGNEATIGDGRLAVDVEIGRVAAQSNLGQVSLPAVEVVASNPTADEQGSQSGTFTISVSGASGPVEVFYSLTGSASNGSDYTAVAGSLLVDGNGVVSIDPIDDNQYNEGTETVVLTLSSAIESYVLGAATVATVEIADNDVASVAADSFSLYETAIDTVLDVLANDTLPGGVAVTSVSTPAQAGTALITGGGQSITYNPPGGYRGDETFSYTVTLPDTSTLTAVATVTVIADLPTATADLFAADEDSSGNVLQVLSNDFLDSGTGDLLSILSTTTPSAGGTITIAGDGLTLLYTPAANFSGDETFSYTIEGPVGDQATAEVTVTVASQADAPIPEDDSYSIAEDSPQTSLAVLSNDSLPPGESGTLTLTAVAIPSSGGTVSISGDALLYTPAANFSGTETLAYTVQTPLGGTATASVTITVTPSPDAPLLVADTISVAEDTGQINLAVLNNDTVPEGESGPLVITSVETPSAGGTVSNTSTALLYTPAANFSGTETISYTVTAPHGGTAIGSVTITVTPEPDTPILLTDILLVAEDSTATTLAVLENDIIPDGESGSLVISAVGTPSAAGSVSNLGSALLYTPAADFNGTETIFYTVTAPHGGTASATATITVTPEPDAPLVEDDSYTRAENSGTSTLTVLDNDNLPPGESGTLVLSAVGTPSAGGSVSISGDTLLYTPATAFSGIETIDYTVTGPDGGTASATVTMTVYSFTSPVDPVDLAGQTGGGLDQLGGTAFAFSSVESEGGDFSAVYNTVTIENVAEILPGFNAEVVDGSSGQVWDLNFTGSFSGEVQLTLRYDPTLIDGADLALAHVHEGTTQILTAMPVGSNGPAPLNQYIVDESLGQIEVTVDQFSGLVLFNQQLISDPSTLGGRVFLDQNGNQQLDSEAGELAVGGVEILLSGPGGLLQTTYTSADGTYQFTDLTEGDYTITQDPTGTLQAVFADGADAVGTQGGSADDAADRIAIPALGSGVSGQDNLHTEGNLQLGFFSRRDFLANTPKTDFDVVVEPGAERAIAYTVGAGWEGVESADIQLSADGAALEVRVTEGGVSEAVVLDATDPDQVWIRGRRNETFLLGIVGSRSELAFAPVSGESVSTQTIGGSVGTDSLPTEDPLDPFTLPVDSGSETESVDALFDELGADTLSGDPLL